MTTDQVTLERLAKVGSRLYGASAPVMEMTKYIKHCQAVFDLTTEECDSLMKVMLANIVSGDKDGTETEET